MAVSVEALQRTERFFTAEEVALDAAVGHRHETTERWSLRVEATFRPSSSTSHMRTPAKRASGLGAGARQAMQAGVRSGASGRVVEVRARDVAQGETDGEKKGVRHTRRRRQR